MDQDHETMNWKMDKQMNRNGSSLRRIFLTLALGATAAVQANDIRVTNVDLVGDLSDPAYVLVQFDIAWQNSWRVSSAPANWDAAWVFVKYRTTDGLWHHAWLDDDSGHNAGTGTPAIVRTGLLIPGQPFDVTANYGVGAFLYRSGSGTGPFVANDVQLRWNHAANGLECEEIAEVQVFAIEMVHVPKEAFYVGSGGTEPASFTDGAWISGTTIPLQIVSEDELAMAPTPGALWGGNATVGGSIGATGTLPDTYPKGYNGYYVMKHEIAQQDYVDFLNTLDRVQQNNHTAADVSGTSVTNRYVMSNQSSVTRRNGIRCDGTLPPAPTPVTFYCDLYGNDATGYANDGRWIACNYLGWPDFLAYLDWSGLRPMTELEYEKTCRGPLAPVPDEFAWGSTTITPTAGTTGSGTSGENRTPTASNAHYGHGGVVTQSPDMLSAPRRVGSFADGSTTREQSGAGHYGALDLSGNVWERVISVAHADGRAFQGLHGDGRLDAAGYANVPTWPAPSNFGTLSTGPHGSGFRGGVYSNLDPGGVHNLRLSTRIQGALGDGTRNQQYGGRGVRVTP